MGVKIDMGLEQVRKNKFMCQKVGGTEMKKLSLLFAVVIPLVFTVSCVSKEVPVTETYYETEYKAEEYRTTEQYEFKTPHATPLFYRARTMYAPFILFSMDGDGTLYWAELERGQAPLVTKLHLEPTGQNHRISVTEPLCWTTIYRSRDPYATTKGFKPGYKVAFPGPGMLLPTKLGASMMPYAIGYGDPNMVKEWTKDKKDYSITYILYLIQDDDGMLDVPSVVQRYAAIPMEFGFDIGKDAVDVCDILNLPKDTRLNEIERPYDFPIEVMFQKGEWCLLEVGATEMIQIDYVWDSVETRTREVTKTRQVPYQVEKQRTVMQTKMVPFWEVLFGE